jgi:geranylgeranyl reductase
MMIFFTNREVQIDEKLMDDKYIGMIRREVMNSFQRDRAKRNDATLNYGLFIGIILPQSFEGSYVLTFVIMSNNVSDSESDVRKGMKKTLEVDMVIGADGANSRVMKDIEANLQEHTRAWDEKMEYCKEYVKMYVGDNMFLDFYVSGFVKHYHVAAGIGIGWKRRTSRSTSRRSRSRGDLHPQQ